MNEFNLNASEVVLSFNCPRCHEWNETDSLGVPSPNWESETIHNSVNSEEYDHICPNCGEEFEIVVSNTIGGGDVQISPEVEELTVNEIFQEEDE